MKNILICDDDRDIVRALTIYLSANPDYNILTAYNGQEAVDIVSKGNIHLVLLDIMMPVMDGITAMSNIRQISNVPIILLTAKGEDTDILLGLDVGADDYITKPFKPVEVVARVKSQLRRYLQLGGDLHQAGIYKIGGIELNDDAKEVSVDGTPISLTPIEYDICKLFMSNPDKVFSIKEIYNLVWKSQVIGAEGTVAVHIRHLREKLEIDPANPRHLKVVWGQGYKITSGNKMEDTQ